VTGTDSPIMYSGQARKLYKEGARFRVMRPGARLEGMVKFGNTGAWSGWGRMLKVGEIVECNGWKNVIGSETVQGANFSARGTPKNATLIQIWPLAGMWRPFPMDGFLELIEGE